MNCFMIIVIVVVLFVIVCIFYVVGYGYKDVKLFDVGYFIDGYDMMFYIFDKDDVGKFNCNVGCVKVWFLLIFEGKVDVLLEGFSVIFCKNGD